MPAVSVVMVFHRLTPFLLPAVQSVLGQTFADFELVLVDNGTGVDAAHFGGDPRIRLVRLPGNEGFAGGYNAGISVARGELTALLDSDDVALPDRLARQVGALRDDPGLGLVNSLAETINPAGVVLGPAFALMGDAAQRAFLAYSVPGLTPSLTGRTALFRRFPFRREFRAAMDYDFWTRASAVTRLGSVPEVLLHYRVHPGQITHAWQDEQVLEACFIRRLAARRRAGRDEGFAGLVAELAAWRAEGVGRAEACRRTAAACLGEGEARLAVYHARRYVAHRRSPAAAAFAAGILAGALRRPGAESRRALLRLWSRGPLAGLVGAPGA